MASPRADAHTTLIRNATKVRVLVLNGTHRPGLASRTSVALATRGFAVARLAPPWVANAPAISESTTIYYDPSQTRARAAATRLSALFRAKAPRPETRTISRLALHAGRPKTVIVLGLNFRGLR